MAALQENRRKEKKANSKPRVSEGLKTLGMGNVKPARPNKRMGASTSRAYTESGEGGQAYLRLPLPIPMHRA